MMADKSMRAQMLLPAKDLVILAHFLLDDKLADGLQRYSHGLGLVLSLQSCLLLSLGLFLDVPAKQIGPLKTLQPYQHLAQNVDRRVYFQLGSLRVAASSPLRIVRLRLLACSLLQKGSLTGGCLP